MTPEKIDKMVMGRFPGDGFVEVPVRYFDEVAPFDAESYREFSLYIQGKVAKATTEPEPPSRKMSHKELQRLTPAARTEYQRRRTRGW